MYNGADIFIDKENNVLFVGAGERMTEESMRKLKEGLSTPETPYKAIYVFEKINSAQYITEQKFTEIITDGSFKYTD